MLRVTARLVLVSLVVSACGGGAGQDPATTTVTGPGATVTQPGSTTAQSTDGIPSPSTTSRAGTASTTSDRLAAPDFTLVLGEGGSYTLSEGEKPVYLVFWAEW